MYPGVKRKEMNEDGPVMINCLGTALKTELNSPSLSKSIEFIMLNPLLFFFFEAYNGNALE